MGWLAQRWTRFRDTAHRGGGRRRDVKAGRTRSGGPWGLRTLERLEPRCLLADTLLITELMAINESVLADDDGEFPDWIEIHNPTTAAVDLDGWHLTDKPDNLAKWAFPAVTLEPGGYLVVFASDKDRTDPARPLHTNFKLDGDGEYLALVRPDAATIEHQYAPQFPRQLENVSYGLGHETTTLVAASAASATRIPADGSLAAGWTLPGFDDSTWTSGATGVGFETGEGQGSAIAYSNHAGNVGTQEYGGSLGHDFVVHQPITVTGLGVFDSGSDGLARNLTAQLWTRSGNSGTRLAELQFTPSDPGVLVGGDRFKPLTSPLVLSPGDYTMVAYGYGSGEPNGNTGGPPYSQKHIDDGVGLISFVGGGRYGNAGSFPATPDGGPANRYSAGTFEFAVAAYTGLIATDVETAMHGVHASAYTRIEFTVGEEMTFSSLSLRMKYDDGFVAYLNGSEVARRNAPPSPNWDSAAAAARPLEESAAFESINLTEHLDELHRGTNVLAIHGLNVDAQDGTFLILPELIAAGVPLGAPRYFDTATPQSPNSSTTSFSGFVDEIALDHQRGFYDAPLDVTINTATANAEIRYTIDGTEPTATHGTRYTGPIAITGQTTLRAAAFQAGLLPTDVQTHTYVFLDDVLAQSGVPSGYPAVWKGGYTADYDVSQSRTDLPLIAGDPSLTEPEYREVIKDSLRSLPTMSIVLPPGSLFDPATGIYVNPGGRGEAWERAASVEYLLPDGSQGFQIDGGLRIMGGTSRNLNMSPKLSLRILFKKEYGAGRLEYPFFPDSPVDSYNSIALRSNTRDSWLNRSEGTGSRSRTLYIRDQWAKVAQGEMGQEAASGSFVHLYLNGLYWGIYNPTERPDAAFAAEHYGGGDEDYDAVKFCCPHRVVDGDMQKWNELLSLAQSGLASDAAYQYIQGNNPDGTRNKDYDVLLDVDNLIDYIINGQYHAANDWPGNYYAVRERGPDSTGFKFFTWDNDLAFPFENISRDKTRSDNNNWWTQSPGVFDIALRSNAEYRMRFADRVYQHYFNGGSLTPEAAAERWTRIADGIEEALIAESARWGDYRRDVAPSGPRVLYTQAHWQDVSSDMLSDYFPVRSNVVLNQLRSRRLYPNIAPPILNQHGGDVPSGFLLNLSAAAGEIYYTLDGSDPRRVGGEVQGRRYTGPAAIAESAIVRTRTLDGTEWSALEEAEFRVSGLPIADDLIITELNYNPYDPTASEQAQGFTEAEQFEFIELQNIGDATLDLTGMQFTDGVDFTFTGSFRGSPILISEAGTARTDYVEIQSVWELPVDTSGWVVAVNDARYGNVQDVLGTLWRLPGSIAAGDVLYRSDDVQDSDHYWGVDVFWMTRGEGWVMIVDHQGEIADFLVWGYDTTDLEALSVTVNGFEVTLAEAWSGASVPPDGTSTNSLQRRGTSDHDDVSDWAFAAPRSEGVANRDLTTPFTSSAIELDPGKCIVVVKNVSAHQARYHRDATDDPIPIAGQYDGQLNNGGERITLTNPYGRAIVDFRYGDSGNWPGRADGKGASLELIDPTVAPLLHPHRMDYLQRGDSWRSSSEYGGSPGYAGSGPMGILINEVLTHTDPPLIDAIELFNTTDRPVDVGGWYLSDSWGWASSEDNGNYKKYRIDAGTVINAHEYLVFDEGHFNPSAGAEGQLDPNHFALSGARGDDAWLMAADAAGELTRFVDHVDFPAAAAGESFGRWPNGEGDLHPMIRRTLGGANSGPRIGPLIISEVHADPGDVQNADELEFVEIYNPTLQPIDLTNWRIRRGIDFDFAEGTTIEAAGTLVVLPFDPREEVNQARWSAFCAQYGLDDESPDGFVGGYTGRLNNAGERIDLQRPDEPPPDDPDFTAHLVEDELDYTAAPRPDGHSLHRMGIDQWGHDSASWVSGAPTPGTADLPTSAAVVVGRHVFYNNSAFDQPGLGQTDDDAVAPDKEALLPGRPFGGGFTSPSDGMATFANYTSYVRGINGVMVDVAGLAGTPTAADFELRVGNHDHPSTWPPAPAPQSVAVRRGAGVDGSDRVTLIWADNAITGQWLQVTVLATAATGLDEHDVFYFGNAIGEAGNSTLGAIVNTTDEVVARNFQHGPTNLAAIDDPYDYNRDRLVNTIDRTIARSGQTGPVDSLRLITVPAYDRALEQAVQWASVGAETLPGGRFGAN